MFGTPTLMTPGVGVTIAALGTGEGVACCTGVNGTAVADSGAGGISSTTVPTGNGIGGEAV